MAYAPKNTNGQATMANSEPVVIASDQSAIPVSGTVSINSIPAGVNNIGDVDIVTMPNVTLNALPAGTANIGDVDVLTLPAVVLTAETTKVIGTVNLAAGVNNIGDVDVLSLPSIPAGTNSIGTTLGPTLTKGTQGATGYAVQRLIDAGRNARHFMLDAFTAAPAVEAVQSVVQWYGNVAVAGTTQPAVVPAGKTLRLQSWTISTKSLATVGSAVVRVRVNTAGLGVLASPLVFSFEAGSRSGATTVAMTGGTDTLTGVFPEGFEIPAGSGLAFSMAGYGPAGVLALQGVTRFQVQGYEY